MKKSSFLLVALLIAACLSSGCRRATKTASTAEEYKPAFKAPDVQSGLAFNSPELQFKLLRALGASSYGAADTGECLMTAMQVDEEQLDQAVGDK